MYVDDDNECRKNYRCELGDRHQGPCKRYVMHDSMCGCEGCASDCERGSSAARFDCVEL